MAPLGSSGFASSVASAFFAAFFAAFGSASFSALSGFGSVGAETSASGRSLEDGSAPEGYTVKGNADSGLYHEPDGQWYEQTVAEVWFKTAKAAEKAGFTKAGSAKKSEDEK